MAPKGPYKVQDSPTDKAKETTTQDIAQAEEWLGEGLEAVKAVSRQID